MNETSKASAGEKNTTENRFHDVKYQNVFTRIDLNREPIFGRMLKPEQLIRPHKHSALNHQMVFVFLVDFSILSRSVWRENFVRKYFLIACEIEKHWSEKIPGTSQLSARVFV